MILVRVASIWRASLKSGASSPRTCTDGTVQEDSRSPVAVRGAGFRAGVQLPCSPVARPEFAILSRTPFEYGQGTSSRLATIRANGILVRGYKYFSRQMRNCDRKWITKGSLRSQPSLIRRPYGIESVLGPNVHLTFADCRSGVDVRVKIIDRQNFPIASSTQHDDLAMLAGDVDLAVDADG